LRVAAINLRTLQDDGDLSREALIQFHTDGIRPWNPGDIYGDASRLLEPAEKEVRNPAIAMALRRVNLCEQAGTGMRVMQREWQALGHGAPRIDNDRARKAYGMFLPERIRLEFTTTPEVTAEVRRRSSAAPVGSLGPDDLDTGLHRCQPRSHSMCTYKCRGAP
jgi:predicted HTH transcriptional regulator